MPRPGEVARWPEFNPAAHIVEEESMSPKLSSDVLTMCASYTHKINKVLKCLNPSSVKGGGPRVSGVCRQLSSRFHKRTCFKGKGTVTNQDTRWPQLASVYMHMSVYHTHVYQASTGLCVHAHVCISHMYTKPHLTSVYTCMCVYHTHTRIPGLIWPLCVVEYLFTLYTCVSA